MIRERIQVSQGAREEGQEEEHQNNRHDRKGGGCFLAEITHEVKVLKITIIYIY